MRRWALVLPLLLVGCGADPRPSLAELNLAQRDSARVAAALAQFEPPGRDRWQQPDLVVASLAIPPAATVVDLGAGTGYFIPHLLRSRRVRRLIAAEADSALARYLARAFAQHIDQTMSHENGRRLEVAITPADAPALPPHTADRILLVETFAHLTRPEAYCRALLPILTPRGRLLVVDVKPGAPVPTPDSLRRPPHEVIATLQRAGFRSFELDTTLLPYHYLISAE